MRQLQWTSKALSDLARLFEFLAQVNRSAAARTVQSLVQTPDTLLNNPRLGEQLEEFKPRDVRRLLVGYYEIRYEVQGMTLSCVLGIVGKIVEPLSHAHKKAHDTSWAFSYRLQLKACRCRQT